MKRNSFRSNRDIPAFALGCILLASLITPLSAQTAPAEAQIPDNDRSPYHVALLAYKAAHFQEALDTLNQGAPKTQDEKIIILKSRILTELGQYDEGIKLLTPLLTPGSSDVQLAIADLLMRKRDFNGASKYYNQLLTSKPGDPDLILMMVYTRVGASDLVTAAKIASTLKPLDQANPSYYFARAALAQSTDKSQEAEDDIETARTMYGITVTNHYLKTYLEVLSAPAKGALITPTNSPAASAPAAPAKN